MNIGLLKLAKRGSRGERHWIVPGHMNAATLWPTTVEVHKGWRGAFCWPVHDYCGGPAVRKADLGMHRRLIKCEARRLVLSCLQTCTGCGTPLPASRRKNAKTCSSDCAKESHRRSVRASRARMTSAQKERKNTSQREWRARQSPEQREKQNKLVRKWRANLTPQQREDQRWYERRRIIEIVNVRLARSVRVRLNGAIRTRARRGAAVNELGCTITEFMAYIESKFAPEMTWKNWSRTGWHLDHVKPLASFDLTDLAQIKQATHYTNYQPLWAPDNASKGAKS